MSELFLSIHPVFTSVFFLAIWSNSAGEDPKPLRVLAGSGHTGEELVPNNMGEGVGS